MTACKTAYRFRISTFNVSEVKLEEWFRANGVGYNWYTTAIIDPRTFEAIISILIEDELFAMQFKLTWSEFLETK